METDTAPEIAPTTHDAPADPDEVSLEAQVAHLEERAAAAAADLATARAATLETERAFLASRAAPGDLAAAKANVAALEAAHGAITARLAPLRTQLDAEVAGERQRRERAAAWQAVVDQARTANAAYHALRKSCADGVDAFVAALNAVWQARLAAGEAQEEFWRLVEDYEGTGPDEIRAVLSRLERAGEDVTGVRVKLPDAFHPLQTYGEVQPLTTPDRGPLTQEFARYAMEPRLARPGATDSDELDAAA